MSISLGGRLLLADPSLKDGIFRKSVIILSEHSLDQGAAGAIINHPSDKTVGDLVPNLTDTPLSKLRIHHGGPLATDQLTFSSLAWNQNSSGLVYLPRISAQAAATYIGINGNLIQASIGHSAWAPGQLEYELRQKTWITQKPTETLISSPLDQILWKTLLETISPYHSLLAEAPDDPTLN